MERKILDKLVSWKSAASRKPLLIRGARQVGKTWVMQTFGRENYEKVVYVNFEKDKLLQDLFQNDFNIGRILLALQIQSGVAPEPGNTLIIFDEIQEAKGALTSLKYFYENAPEYHIIGAGSLLGVTLSKGSFPVGKVEFLEMHPMSFSEFLMAVNEHELLKLISAHDWGLIKTFRSKFVLRLKQYYFVGGMPEAVNSFAKENDFGKVRRIQTDIQKAYELDFSKHAPNEIVPRLRQLWNSIPGQLARENKKFIYGLIKEGARAREYESALSWLEDYGLVHRIYRVTKPGIPLKSYEDLKAFKIYTSDVGMLCTLSGLNEKVILEGNRLFSEYKGALTEQFVLQQFISDFGINPHYWSNENSTSEVDFLIESDNQIYPVEVKAEENLQAKSLALFHKKYNPVKSVRISLSDFREEDWLVNIPLFAFQELIKILN